MTPSIKISLRPIMSFIHHIRCPMKRSREEFEPRVLRLQLIMLGSAILAWFGMLTRALAQPLEQPLLDDIGFCLALVCLMGFGASWLLAAHFSGNDQSVLLTAVNDEHAAHMRVRAETFGFRAVLVYLFATQMLADSELFDIGVAATSQLGLLLGLVCALAAFLWAQRP